jgi:transposase
MARFKRGMDLDQQLLLPPSLREWLPEDHLVWFIRDAVDALNLDELTDRYRQCGKGELPYQPSMMLRVLIYSYATGVFSSRKIAKQLEDSVSFRVLAENQMPSHRTICRFRQDNLDLFPDLFIQVVRLAHEAGIARIGTLAIDGSKVKANASKRKAMSYGRMVQEEKRLKREIQAILRLATEKDAEEDQEFGPDFRGDQLPAELADRQKRLAKIREAKKRLEARKAEEAAARRGDRDDDDAAPPQSPARPKPKDQENFTDPDSRIMMASTGFEQCYNAQAATAEGSRIIVAADVTNCAADAGQLLPMVEAAMANTGSAADRVLADAGYCSEANLAALEEAEIDAYVAVGREGKPLHRPEKSPCRARMQRKLATKRGRKRYRKRKHAVEPVFGWVKSVLGFRSFSLRGIEKVKGEWNLLCMALNLRRMQALWA